MVTRPIVTKSNGGANMLPYPVVGRTVENILWFDSRHFSVMNVKIYVFSYKTWLHVQ